METSSLREKRTCPCGAQFPEGTAANRRYCDACHRQRNRDYWTRYSHSREPLSYPCAAGCGITLVFQHDQMGRPPKYCETCRSTISQERHKRKRLRKEEPEVQFIELSQDAEQSLLKAFQRLPDVSQRALTYWIGHVIQPTANSIGARGSQYLRRDFASEAFLVGDEEFKGAMLLCGYRPVNGGDQDNWKFRMQKKYPDQKERYGMPGHDPVFARMVDAVDTYWERSSIS